MGMHKAFTKLGKLVHRVSAGKYEEVGRSEISDLDTALTAQETAAAAEAAALAGRKEELTESGAVDALTRELELNHATVIIEATMAAPPGAGEIMKVKDTSASGTAAHTVTLTGGTWDGTNTIATFDAPDEEIAVLFDSDGNGTVLANNGTVVFS